MKLTNLIENGYTILNGKIENLSLRSTGNGELILLINIIGDGWKCDYAGLNLMDKRFSGFKLLYDLMNVLHIDELYKANGLNVRIAAQSNETPVTIIGNIMYDEWFSYIDYYDAGEETEQPEFEFIDETKQDIEEEKIEDNTDD